MPILNTLRSRTHLIGKESSAPCSLYVCIVSTEYVLIETHCKAMYRTLQGMSTKFYH